MIITNFATKEYFKAQERLVKSLNGHKAAIYKNYQEIGSPSHKESPYQFKIHAIEKASKLDRVVLWCDSSLWLVGDLSKIEDIILRDGFFGSEAGHYVGRWTNDFTKQYFQLTSDELHQGDTGMIMFSAGLLGLDFSNPVGIEFFRRWKASALAGCFKGSFENHRHDMSCASIIAQRMGLKFQRGGQHLSYIGDGYTTPEPDSVFHLQGLV